MLLLGIMLTISLVVLAICLYCYRVAFYAPPRKAIDPDVIDIPEGPIYEPFRPMMEEWGRQTRALPQEHFHITSFDGLDLWATYYEFAPGAPIELMFHGYRGSAQRDLAGGVQRCFACRRSAFIVDQRCAGRSEGKTITFGVNERKDCLKWLEFMLDHFGPDVRILLTGISMGAATVIMAGGEELPPNVIGILADCGYNSQKDIQMKVIRQMGLPPRLSYPFVKLAARIFGRFDLEEVTPEEAVRRIKVPVIFFHGEDDDFVPCDMSRKLFDLCPARKHICTIPGAGHGLSFPVDQARYLRELMDFFGPEASAQ